MSLDCSSTHVLQGIKNEMTYGYNALLGLRTPVKEEGEWGRKEQKAKGKRGRDLFCIPVNTGNCKFIIGLLSHVEH